MNKENYLADPLWSPLRAVKPRWCFPPEKTALLVLDMQHYFLSPDSHAWIPAGTTIIPAISAMQDYFLERGRTVVQTRHCNNVGDAGMMALQWRELLAKENPLSLIIPELAHPRIPCLEKSQYDAFYRTGLEKRLRREGIAAVVICGVMTHLCCESTARSAFCRGFGVFIASDATAAYNRHYHDASLLNLGSGFAAIQPWREILERLDTLSAGGRE